MSSKKQTTAKKQTAAKKAQQRTPSTPSFLPWVILGLVIIVVAVGALIITRNNSATTDDPTANTGSFTAEVSVAQAAARRDAGAYMLDVREPSEWREYHMPGSTLIPLGELANRVSEVPRDREIVVVCRSGNRSQEGRDILVRAGFTNVTSMAGGLSTWRSQGYPTETGQ